MTRTLERFKDGLQTVPADVAWYLSDLGRSLGRQQLFAARAPQKLKALKEHAIVQSAVSSNRMEGIEVNDRRGAGYITIPEKFTDQDLIQALLDADILCSFAGKISDVFKIDGDDSFISIDLKKTGEMLLQLELQ